MMMRVVLLAGLILCFVEGQNIAFEQECNVLQTLEALQSRLDSAEKRLQEHETELAETRSSLTDTVTRLQDQENQINQQNTELAETKSSLTDAVTRLQDQDTEILNLKSSLTVLSRPSQNKTAFTARLSSSITGLGTQQTIVFDDVLTNINDCYSATTGIFTANTNGTFFFFVSITSQLSNRVITEMVKNGLIVALTHSFVPEQYGQGASGTILDLTVGDKVWVRQNFGDKVFGGGWSTFSGVQIQ